SGAPSTPIYQKTYWRTHPEAAEHNRQRQRQLDRQRRVTALVKNHVALDLKHSAAEVWLVGPDAANLLRNTAASFRSSARTGYEVTATTEYPSAFACARSLASARARKRRSFLVRIASSYASRVESM